MNREGDILKKKKTKETPFEVKPGQVFRDVDQRKVDDESRYLRVESVQDGYAICTSVRVARDKTLKVLSVRKSTVSINRFALNLGNAYKPEPASFGTHIKRFIAKFKAQNV